MSTNIQIYDKFQMVITATLNGVGSGSRPVYEGAIRSYLAWAQKNPGDDAYSSLIAYRRYMEDRGLQFATINRHLSALRNFFQTAYHMDQLPEHVWKKIQEVKNIPSRGQKRGNWLNLEEAQRLLDAPDTTTFIGLRDRAILAVMLGCGLRRSEVANLRWDHLIKQDETWLIENLLGKHNRVRSIPLQGWVAKAISKYTGAVVDMQNGPKTNQLFWSVDRHGNWHDSISTQAIWLIVERYAKQCGFDKLAPHDLRRTYAELARKNGAELEEVQALLGHSSLSVTQKYLSNEIDPQRISGLIPLEVE